MPRSQVNDRSDVMPFEGATDLHTKIANALALVTDWNAALSGHVSLNDVIGVLARQRGACNVALVRLNRNKALPVAGATGRLAEARPEPSSGAILRHLRDHRAEGAEPGAMVYLSDLMRDADFAGSGAAAEWRARPKISAVQVIILETTAVQIDAIEMWFDTPAEPDPEMPDALIARALADGWSVRSPGLITRAIRTYGRPRAASRADPSGAILGAQNRCGLSRSERRVCQLLAAGEKAKDIAQALEISIPTVRTHLRNIYAKTETSGQVDLLAVIGAERDLVA